MRKLLWSEKDKHKVNQSCVLPDLEVSQTL